MQVEMDFGFDAIKVHTANNGGHSPDAVAEMCVDKLMSVSTSAPPEIRCKQKRINRRCCKLSRIILK